MGFWKTIKCCINYTTFKQVSAIFVPDFQFLSKNMKSVLIYAIRVWLSDRWIIQIVYCTSVQLENVLQHQEMHLAQLPENLLQNIIAGNFRKPCRKFCHFIHWNAIYKMFLLFKNSKYTLEIEIVLCRDWSLPQCVTPRIRSLKSTICTKLAYTGNFLAFSARKRNIYDYLL